jgi:HlyD family secretion protein
VNRKRVLIGVIIVVLIAVIGAYLSARGRNKGVEGSGTVEARNIRVGSKVGGRIAEVRVREGERVEAGQVLVTFEDQELLAALEQARARAAMARANLDKLQSGSRPEEIEEARAAEAQAAAALHEADRNYKRAQELAEQGIMSRQQLDDAEAAWKVARARDEQAKATRQKVERGFRAEDVAAARAELMSAQATLLDAESRYRERHVASPSAAVVEVLDIRPGDLVGPNAPIALLLERDQIFVRIYIPETRIGSVRVGQKGEVRLDPFPDEVFEGEVEQINQRAEFLPRNVQTKEERVHQVIGVKLRIRDPEGKVRPGMAADVRLKLEN